MATAPVFSYYALDADHVISDNSIRVDNMFFTNYHNQNLLVTVTDKDSTIIMKVALATNSKSCINFRGSWMADNGLRVSSVGTANVKVVVLHSRDGA